MIKAVFVDRDGTLCEEVGPIDRWEQIQWIPDAVDALREVSRMGYGVVIVSNQAAIGKGLIKYADVQRVNEQLIRFLLDHGVDLKDSVFCPHHPDASALGYKIACDCRKPQPGLILRAASRHEIDISRSLMVGDNLTDVVAGRHAGCLTGLVLTGHGKRFRTELADFSIDSIKQLPSVIGSYGEGLVL